MSHQEAKEQFLAEQYLLGELTGTERETFEEHMFECEVCATEVKNGVLLLTAARRQFDLESKGVATSADNVEDESKSAGNRLMMFPLRRAWWSLAAAACMLLGYQNLFVLPRLHQQLAQAIAPSVLQEVVLAGAGPRGGPEPVTVRLSKESSLLLSVDVPSSAKYQKYLCSLFAPEGNLLWRLELTPAEVRNSVPIRVPAQQTREGDNLLTVQGISSPGPDAIEAAVELAQYRFRVILLP